MVIMRGGESTPVSALALALGFYGIHRALRTGLTKALIATPALVWLLEHLWSFVPERLIDADTQLEKTDANAYGFVMSASSSSASRARPDVQCARAVEPCANHDRADGVTRARPLGGAPPLPRVPTSSRAWPSDVPAGSRRSAARAAGGRCASGTDRARLGAAVARLIHGREAGRVFDAGNNSFQ